MEKAKKIISQAKTNIAETKRMVSSSDAAVAETKQSIAMERESMASNSGVKNPDSDSGPETVPASARKGGKGKTSGQPEKVNRNRLDFPVVGIGASAGGLEALQLFFEHMTAAPGAAFVVVQHLSPDHNSFMGELLSRYTSIPVDFIRDGMKIEVNHIYLIPPKVNITMRGGVLYHEQVVGRGLNLPIDIFFRSLAEDQQSNAIAIIMSGAGSDGSLGIRAIKEFGGIAMVQDPRDAKFDGMPKSALSTDIIDLVRPAVDLASELISYLRHPLFAHPGGETDKLNQDNQTLYQRIMAILKSAKKVDFSSYRRETITRRLEKRISINRFKNLADYVVYLEQTPSEADTLFHEILIGVTRFFRDPEAFESLEKQCFPAMFQKLRSGGELRIWCASCSTGEEAYSIAILLKEYMLKNRLIADVKIFATDIDDKSLKFAANGFYPQNVTSDIPPPYLAKYFSPRGSGYQINPEIRRMIIFAPQDLIDNPPFFKLDLVTCRNFLIYICPEAQQRVLSSFYVGLKTGGFLFLGPSESLEELSRGFDTIAAKEKIFRKHDGYVPKYSPRSPMPLHLSLLEHTGKETPGTSGNENSELLAILEQVGNAFLPPSLVVDSECNIIYAIRDGGNLLKMSSGRITTNLLKILPKDLSLIISSLVRRAEGKPDIISAEIVLDSRPVTARCKHILPENSLATYYYICFEDVAGAKAAVPRSRSAAPELAARYQERIDELEVEVQQQKESLRIAVEQLKTSNEELQASNEELVASNEELQSSNEELQSVNEELYTVNIEHVRKLEEITELNYDYDNLLSNTQIGTLFLDANLVVRKISRIAGELTGIMQNDIGRSLSYFSLRKLYTKFVQEVEHVNTTKRMIEKELLLHGRTYCMRIVPYLAEEHEPRGVIVTFVDLTECKMRAIQEATESQGQARMSFGQLEAAAKIARLAYFQINTNTRLCTGSEMLSELMPLQKGCIPHPEEWIVPEDLDEVNARFDELRNGTLESVLLSFRSRYFGELRYYRMGASINVNAAGEQVVLGVIQNTTRVIQDQQRQEAQERLWEDSINAMPVLFYAKDADDGFRYRFVNRSFLEFVGKRQDEVIGKTDEEITPASGRYRAEDVRAMLGETAVSFENEAALPDGNIRYFHTTKQRNIGVDGHRLVLGVGADVTEQRLAMQDMQTANQCLSALLEPGDVKTALRSIMALLCERMGASHCYWMLFDYNAMTVKCEQEYVRPGRGRPLFGKYGAMPFTAQAEWYKCYADGKVLDIPDISATQEAVALLARYCGFPDKVKAQSLYSIGIREQNVIVGAVGFIYTSPRPVFSPERLAYLMSFAANLFRNALRRNQP